MVSRILDFYLKIKNILPENPDLEILRNFANSPKKSLCVNPTPCHLTPPPIFAMAIYLLFLGVKIMLFLYYAYHEVLKNFDKV